MRPLALCLLACAAAFSAESAPATDGRRELRKKVCSEGAYLRGPRTAAEGLSGASAVEGREPGAGDGALFRFTPPAEGCDGALERFFSGAGAGFEISPAFETDASGVRVELRPEQAAQRMVRLRSLSQVATVDPQLAGRFFDNKLAQGDVRAIATLDRDAGLPRAPGLSSYYVSDGKPRVPFSYTALPRRTGLAQDTVPDPREASPLRRTGEWEVPADRQVPDPASQPWYSRAAGRARGAWNDLRAEVGDRLGGAPISAWEGGNRFLPEASHTNYPPGSPNTVGFVPVPNAPGLRHACQPGCFGTPKVMQMLAAMGAQYAQYFPGETFPVGGVSLPKGGPFPPHVSHQIGLDADIPFPTRGFDVQRNSLIVASVVRALPDFRKINGRQYILIDASKHASLRWGLDRLVQEGNLTAEQRDRAVGTLTHWPSHNDHFHIRITR